MLVDVLLVATNTGTAPIDLASILTRDLILLEDADGISHKCIPLGDSEIVIHPGTTIRQRVTFRMVGGGTPARLHVVDGDPIPLPPVEPPS